MMPANHLVAIYDFELFPYALGDVLTWNVRTAMVCEEKQKKCVDIYICLDKEYPASIYQRGLINPDNFELFFNELYSAFGTHPKLGNIFIFRKREMLIEALEGMVANADEHDLEAIHDYLAMLKDKVGVDDGIFRKIYNKIEKRICNNAFLEKVAKRVIPQSIRTSVRDNLSNEKKLNDYFIKYIYSHEAINEFAKQKGFIPFLQPALGCGPDVDELIARRFAGKKLVPFHLRLRRLDIGLGGDHTYSRDSDFLEWYDFLNKAHAQYPDVQFIVLGRLQEKPLEILRLPNVCSLRLYGLGLGHELTLMLKSDLFIGTSSGFAALANFSAIPYFITRMNPGSCQAYAIPEGTSQLPFASANQQLIYEDETSELLMTLLEKGLHLSVSSGSSSPEPFKREDWIKWHTEPTYPSRTTSRFYIHEDYRHEETAYLLKPYFQAMQKALDDQDHRKANAILSKLKKNFPDFESDSRSYF